MEENPDRKRGSKVKLPRLYHKKSRNGCQRCRARRVKCDEKTPVCSNCSRHSVSCTYDTLELSGSRSSSCVAVISEDVFSTTSAIDADLFYIPESKSRRILELRLLQNFISRTSIDFPACHNSEVQHTWSVEVPELALDHENLLYEVLSISALHLLRNHPDDPELLEARRIYRGLSLREHRRAVSSLDPHKHSDSADAALFASMLLLYDAFASLQDRELTPYSPPTEYFHMAIGLGYTFKAVWDAMKTIPNLKVVTIVESPPHPEDSDLLSETNRAVFSVLLSREIPGDEDWNQKTREAYEKTLGYLGAMYHAFQAGENFLGICRRMMAFPLFIPKKFIEFLEEERPRALIILAHFFAFAAGREDIWWISSVVQRERESIRTRLPVEWQGLAMAGLTPNNDRS